MSQILKLFTIQLLVQSVPQRYINIKRALVLWAVWAGLAQLCCFCHYGKLYAVSVDKGKKNFFTK